MIYVANPLYDAVFKYLMEDERIAKTILSALLKKKVLDVKMRRHEYTNINRVDVSMYRVDFAATVVDEEEKPHLMLIELQKTWLLVQIPLLHGKVNNKLEKVLSFFDQTHTADNKKVIRIDETQIEGDEDMDHIVRRLQAAAADPDMRNQMNVEDEYFKELEARDTEIMEKDATIQQLDATVKEKNAAIEEQNSTIKEQNSMLKATIQGLLGNGMSLEAVSKMLGKTEHDVKTMLEK